MKKRSSPRDYTSTIIYGVRRGTLAVSLRAPDHPLQDQTIEAIGHPWDVWTVLETVFGTLDEEQQHLVLLLLDGAGDLRSYKIMSSGGRRKSVMAERRAIIRTALVLGSYAIILAHNHPIGPAAPSESELRLTRELVWACEAADIGMVDFIIWTRSRGMCSIRRERPDLFEPPKLT